MDSNCAPQISCATTTQTQYHLVRNIYEASSTKKIAHLKKAFDTIIEFFSNQIFTLIEKFEDFKTATLSKHVRVVERKKIKID